MQHNGANKISPNVLVAHEALVVLQVVKRSALSKPSVEPVPLQFNEADDDNNDDDKNNVKPRLHDPTKRSNLAGVNVFNCIMQPFICAQIKDEK